MNPSTSALPESWTDVLVQIEAALSQTDAEATRAEQALAAPVSPAALNAESSPDALARLAERLRRLRECAAQAQQTAVDADAAVEHGEAALRQWLTEAAALRGKLANADGTPLS
jgi:hypothetical protein